MTETARQVRFLLVGTGNVGRRFLELVTMTRDRLRARLGLVLIPVVVWLFWTDQSLWGSIMIFWTIVVGTIDNFIRPVLIKKGADLPLLLIFAGVIGGLIAFGVIGLFIGPVMLAVTYTLLSAWVVKGEKEQVQVPLEEQNGI